MAIEHAHRVLDWQENLMSEEMPPEWMWPFDTELEEWFEAVEASRKNRYGGSEDEETSDMVQNEYAR